MAISTIFLNKMQKMNFLKTQKFKMNYWIGRGAVEGREGYYMFGQGIFLSRKLQRILKSD